MPKAEGKVVKIPGTQLIVPENMPQVVWRLMAKHRSDSGSLPSSIASMSASACPIAWAEGSDWLSDLAKELRAEIEGKEKISTDKEAPESPAPEPMLRYKCSLFDCPVMSSKEKPLQVCGRCHNARYCSGQHQKEDWPAHKKICRKSETAADQIRQLKQLCCTQLMEAVLNAELALAHAVLRQRLGPGAMLVGMRELVHLAQDTDDAARTRQIWITFATLDELAVLKEDDPRLHDVECAAKEMHAMLEKGDDVVPRDLFCFLDDGGFSLTVAAPQSLSAEQRAAVVAKAHSDLKTCDMIAVDLPTQRRFVIRAHDVEVRKK